MKKHIIKNMEKKKYHKPQINVIAIDAVGIMAVSTETIKKGNTNNVSSDMLDENGYFLAE